MAFSLHSGRPRVWLLAALAASLLLTGCGQLGAGSQCGDWNKASASDRFKVVRELRLDTPTSTKDMVRAINFACRKENSGVTGDEPLSKLVPEAM